eukprot:m.203198 g.203198  ORF g.203198 m.203198 type:complete len:1456 (-) comp13727_c0_seq3:225-4592(-)
MTTSGPFGGMLLFGGRSSRVNTWDTESVSLLTDTWVLRGGEWERVVESDAKHSPIARYGATLSTIENTAYLIGGANGKEMLHEVWEFDFSYTSWNDYKGADGGGSPLPRKYHTASVRGFDEIVLVGGVDVLNATTSDLKYSQLINASCIDLWIFNVQQYTWRKVEVGADAEGSPCPPPTYLHASVFDTETKVLYIHGGLVPNDLKTTWDTTSSSLWKLNMTTPELQWKWEELTIITPKAVSAARFDHEVALLSNNLFLFYGKLSSRVYPSNFVVKINLTSLQASLIIKPQQHVPQPRSGMSLLSTYPQMETPTCNSVQGNTNIVFVIFGGETEFTSSLGTTYKDTWQFDPQSETWERIVSNAFPPDRFGHAGTVAHGKLVQTVVEGVSGDGGGGHGMNEYGEEHKKRDILYCIFAGYNPVVGFLSDLWILRGGKESTQIPEWTQLVPRNREVPPARSGHSMVAMDFLDDGGAYEYLLVHGGISSLSTFSPLSDTRAFNTSSEKWVNMTQEGCFVARTYHAAVALDNTYMLVFGGQGFNSSACRDWHDPEFSSTGENTNPDHVGDHCFQSGGDVVAFGCKRGSVGGRNIRHVGDSGESHIYDDQEHVTASSMDAIRPHGLNADRTVPAKLSYGLFGDVRVCEHSGGDVCMWSIVQQVGSDCINVDSAAKYYKRNGYCFPMARSHHTGVKVSVPKHAAISIHRAIGDNPVLLATTIIFGGIVGPDPSSSDTEELELGSDVWLLHTFRAFDGTLSVVWDYVALAIDGDVPPPRWSHAATSLYTNKFFITGGFSNSEVLQDCWILDMSDEEIIWRWHQIGRKEDGEAIPLRANHIVLPVSIGREHDRHDIVSTYNQTKTMSLLLLGGTALDIHTVDLQLAGILNPQCSPGYFSDDFRKGPCLPCPIGKYAPGDGNSCKGCPKGTTTPLEGSVSIFNCTICVPQYCNGQGCKVSVVSSEDIHPDCDCNPFMSKSSRCRRLTWVVDIVIAMSILIVFVIVIFYLSSKLKRRNENMLDLEDQIQELANVWIINEKEIEYLTRIDDEAPGVSSIVSKGKFRGIVVAVKKLKTNLSDDIETQRQFRKEVRLMKNLRHANIVQFIGAGSDSKGNPFIVTEFLDRGSLSIFLQSPVEKFTIVRQLKFARDAASGMMYLHNHNPPFIHRDLKTANLLVHRDYTVKVSDFGTSLLMNLGEQSGNRKKPQRRQSLSTQRQKRMSSRDNIDDVSETQSSMHTTTASYSSRSVSASTASDLLISHAVLMDANSNNYVGTPLYLSPEVWMAQTFSRASDVFAFGIVLWEIMTRESNPYPHISGPSRVLKNAVLDGQRPKIPKWIGDDLRDLMKTCWQEDAEKRCAFSDIVTALDKTLQWERSQLHRKVGLNTEYDNNYDEFDSSDDEMLDARAFYSDAGISHFKESIRSSGSEQVGSKDMSASEVEVDKSSGMVSYNNSDSEDDDDTIPLIT